MKQMAESRNYLILNEYEKVFLKLKETSQLILIGEFYGDPDVALISADEKYCAVGGEGVIIYYTINEHFQNELVKMHKKDQAIFCKSTDLSPPLAA